MSESESNAEPCCDDKAPAKTILLIEDDEKFARIVEKVLEARGYEVIHAPTAKA